MRRICPILFSALLTFTSCGGGGGSDSSSGGSGCSALGARVFDGETCNQSARSPVIAFFPVISSGGVLGVAAICTGTLVTVNQVVTSAHCIENPVSQFGRSLLGFAVVVGGGEGEGIIVSRYAIHPGYNGQAGSPFDVAVVTLERSPNPPVGPVPLILSQRTSVGDDVTTFGYGTSNKGEIGVLKAGDMIVEDVEGGNLIASPTNGTGSICQGDSGGPLVRDAGGVVGLVGVNSFGDVSAEQCAETGGSISGFVDLQNKSVHDFIVANAPSVAVR